MADANDGHNNNNKRKNRNKMALFLDSLQLKLLPKVTENYKQQGT